MKKIILDNIGFSVISLSDIQLDKEKEEKIYVSVGEQFKCKLHKQYVNGDVKFCWDILQDTYYHNYVFNSIEEAIEYEIKDNYEVFVLNNFEEFKKWIIQD